MSNLDKHVAAREKKTPMVSKEGTRTRSRTPYDPGTCPPGLDPKLWHLAQFFEQLATKNGYKLPQGLFLIHDYLLARVDKLGLREKPATVWRDSKGDLRTWDVFVEAAIREYWSRGISDEAGDHALDDFYNEGRFKDMLWIVMERARNKRLVEKGTRHRPERTYSRAPRD